MTILLRLAMFIDAQNTYLNARECFFGGGRAGVSADSSAQWHWGVL